MNWDELQDVEKAIRNCEAGGQPWATEAAALLRSMSEAIRARPEGEAQEAARYRWIRKNALWRTGYREQSVTWDVYMHEPDIREGKLTDDSVALELDAAIDNAMNSGSKS